MPFYLIERNLAEKLQILSEESTEIHPINDQENVRWLISFLSIDSKISFCLFDAVSFEVIRKTVERAGIPVDEIIEVSEEMMPTWLTHKLRPDRNL